MNKHLNVEGFDTLWITPRACERNFPVPGLSDSDQGCGTAVQIHTAKHLSKSSLCQQTEIPAGYE